MIQKRLLSFIHIEKAAGQTFIRILENNYIYKHCRVSPLKKEHEGVFQWADLKILLRANPMIEAVAGHSVMPSSDLGKMVPNIRYITLFREPIKRYISHYQYWIQVLNRKLSFEDYLSLEKMKNFQTKKIAGSGDITEAIKIIETKMFLAGILEEFDDFLIVLRNKLTPQPFDISYVRKNVAKSNTVKLDIEKDFHRYKEKIYENNRKDIELYNFVKNETFKKEKDRWLKRDVVPVSMAKDSLGQKIKRDLIGRVYRNLYMGPIINLIRYKNGLRIGGSY